jgi:hypothetical protein
VSDAPAADPSQTLAEELLALGVSCRVEGRGRLALLRMPATPPALADAAVRRRVTALAAAHGFTHVALELEPGIDDREALRSS